MYHHRLSNTILCVLLFTSSPLWAWQPAPLLTNKKIAAAHQSRHASAFTWRLEAARMYNSEMTNGQYYDGMDEYGVPPPGGAGGNYYDSMEYGGGEYNSYRGGGGFYNDRRRNNNNFNNNRPTTSRSGSDDHETLGPVRKSRASSFWNTPADNMRRDGNHETLGPQPYFESAARKNRAQSFWTTGSERREQVQRNQPYNPRRPISRYDNMNPGSGVGGGGYQQDFGPRRNDFGGRGVGGGYNRGGQRLYNGGGGGVGGYNDRRGNNNWSPLPPAYQNNNFDPMDYDMYQGGGGPGGFNDPRGGGGYNEDYRWNPRSRGGPQRYPMTTKRSQYQSGVTSPISSEKFQDSIGSHTSMGPMPAWERRKMEKKWREGEDYDDYYW